MLGRLGVIGGEGDIVGIALKRLEERGERVFIVDVTGTGYVLEAFPHFTGASFSVGEVGRIIKRLKREHVERVVFLGKVDKRALYRRKKFDMRALRVLLSLRDFSDDALLKAAIRELEGEGISVVGQKSILPEMVPLPGILGRLKPSKGQWLDVAFGFKMAREIGRLGIGQTVVVKARSVVAVEAVEGTDTTIIRGGELAGEGITVVKVKRPGQSDLMDLPLIGLKTLEVMEKVGGKVLAVEAHETIILDIREVVKEADRRGIVLMAVDEEFLASWLRY